MKGSADTSDAILEAAKKLATILRERRAFTNTATFDLKCEVSWVEHIQWYYNSRHCSNVERASKVRRMREHMHKRLDTYDLESIEVPARNQESPLELYFSPVTCPPSISMTTGTWSDAPYISLRISHIFTFSTMRSLNTTDVPGGISELAFVRKGILTHVQSPTYTFHTAIETIREIGVMLDIWITSSPNIDKF